MLYLCRTSICLGVLSNASILWIFSGSKVAWQTSYGGGGQALGAAVVTTGEAVAVAETVGEVVAVV